jgi:hypothetical protein
MKKEKEMLWIVLLHASPHTRDVLNFRISPEPACKKDFERLVGSGENNKEFTIWINYLIECGVLEPVGKITKGSRNNVVADGYIVSANKLQSYAKSHLSEVYDHFSKFFSRDKII